MTIATRESWAWMLISLSLNIDNEWSLDLLVCTYQRQQRLGT